MKVSRSELGSSCGAVVPAAAISLSWGDCRHKQLSAEVDGLRHCSEQLVRRRKIRFLLDNGQQNCTRWEVEAKTPNQDIFLIKKCLGQSLWFCHTVVSEYLLELSLDETKSVQDQSVGLTEPHVRHPPTSMIGPFAEWCACGRNCWPASCGLGALGCFSDCYCACPRLSQECSDWG